MKLIIVEDEVRLRNSLTYLIPWDEHGIEVIGVYGDGLEGLQGIRHAKPDILLLDIEIPGISGLQLAEQALSFNASTKVVILSGHDEFKFAQTAIELGVYKYLLKPAGDMDILSAVTESADQLKRERESQYRRLMLEQKWEEHIPRLQEGFLQNWLSGRYDAWEIDKKAKRCSLRFIPIMLMWWLLWRWTHYPRMRNASVIRISSSCNFHCCALFGNSPRNPVPICLSMTTRV